MRVGYKWYSRGFRGVSRDPGGFEIAPEGFTGVSGSSREAFRRISRTFQEVSGGTTRFQRVSRDLQGISRAFQSKLVSVRYL